MLVAWLVYGSTDGWAGRLHHVSSGRTGVRHLFGLLGSLSSSSLYVSLKRTYLWSVLGKQANTGQHLQSSAERTSTARLTCTRYSGLRT